MPATRQSQLNANRRWRERNASKKREMDRLYREKNKTVINAKIAEKRKTGEYRRSKSKSDAASSKRCRGALRAKVIAALGGKCVNCGFDDWRAFQIDHVNGGGHRHRQTVSSLSKYFSEILASAAANDGKYQLLCANCNQIKSYEDRKRK